MKRIALVGDYDENKVAHRAIPIAVNLAGGELGADVTLEWANCGRRLRHGSNR